MIYSNFVQSYTPYGIKDSDSKIRSNLYIILMFKTKLNNVN